MADQPRDRDELYQRIRQGGKEEFILSDMIRLGFWPGQGVMPNDPADEIRRRSELQKQLEQLRAENRKLYNEQLLLKELRQRRLAESRKKRQETKDRRERERQARAEAWQQKQQTQIIYLGKAVSGGLNYTTSEVDRLTAQGLPVYQNATELATAIGIDVGALRFLAFSRQTATVSHYVRFKIPKKSGGERLISAPKPRLKSAQHWILRNILTKLPIHAAAQGFCSQHSIVTNARPHVGASAIINIDLKDFFPSISYRRVKGLFRSFGYSEAIATILALLCTEPTIEEVELDGRRYYVALDDRHLPQGAPTSPAITNLLCRSLDRRLNAAASELGFNYTRYADDLTFSTINDGKNICNLLGRIESIVQHEGLTINRDKTRVLRRSRQQEVTGVVVNRHLNISRETLKRFRATVYQIDKDGPEHKHWGHCKDVLASLLGFANFVYMVNPAVGGKLQQQVRALIEKYHWQPRKVVRATKSVLPASSTTTKAEPAAPAPSDTGGAKKTDKKWWKLW